MVSRVYLNKKGQANKDILIMKTIITIIFCRVFLVIRSGSESMNEKLTQITYNDIYHNVGLLHNFIIENLHINAICMDIVVIALLLQVLFK